MDDDDDDAAAIIDVPVGDEAITAQRLAFDRSVESAASQLAAIATTRFERDKCRSAIEWRWSADIAISGAYHAAPLACHTIVTQRAMYLLKRAGYTGSATHSSAAIVFSLRRPVSKIDAIADTRR